LLVLQRQQIRTIGVIFVLVLTLLVVLTICLAPGVASASEACPAWKAERDVEQARIALRKAERRLAEAKRILTATRGYTASFGSSVGRWVRLSRRVGWSWATMPTLMMVVDRESGGDPGVFNYQGSGCAGLLQLAPCHYEGRFSPTDPKANLSYGLKLYRGSGWSPWAL
jgi:hypothetical protein